MNMPQRQATHPEALPSLSTADLRRHYLVESLFAPNALLLLTMSHVERMVIGGAMPVPSRSCSDGQGLSKGPFLARRELGIVNIGGHGPSGRRTVLPAVAGRPLRAQGTASVKFSSASGANPARYYLVSTPAHTRTSRSTSLSKANPMPMGAPATSNERVIYQ